MALFARDRDRYQLDRGGTIVAEHGPGSPVRPIAYPNERAAVVVFRKRVVELMREGWQLVRPDADIGAPLAADAELEVALRDTGDLEELAVYNDWLIEHGDPCGELATMRARHDPILASAIAALERQRG